MIGDARSGLKRETLPQEAREAGVRLVRFLYCDNGGLIRGKTAHVQTLVGRLVSGIGLTVAMQAFSSQDELAAVPGMGPVGEIRLVPDPTTFVVLPYAPASAGMLVDMQQLDGSPWDACPRTFLRRQLDLLADRLDARLEAAFEPEFTLARRTGDDTWEPIDRSRCFSTTGMTAATDAIDAIVAALDAQGLAVEQYYPELGHGQHELSLRHAAGVGGADRQVLLRETVRGVAAAHGLVASFAPKPWLDQAGNGAHVHLSVWSKDGARNLFADLSQPYGMSRFGRQFAAGILAHLPAIVALSAASVNSYRRLQPKMWSSAFTAWGPDNREAAVRVASPFRGDEAATVNLEFKPSDSTGNPYLVLGALVAAGRDGVERKLELGEATLVDPATLSEEERAKRGIRRLPSSLDEALAALEADAFLRAAFPPLLFDAYVAVKRSEIAHFAERDAAYELARHFEIY
jgi:glutamine synthetase